MATYDLEEEEQIEELKTWWKINSWWISTLLFAAAIGAVSWQGWQYWRNHSALAAATLYANVQDAADQKDARRAREAAGALIDQYPSTLYAPLGVLLAAKVGAEKATTPEADDAKSAIAQLTWAAEQSKDASLKDLARLRLAALLLDAGQYDAALQRLEADPVPAWQPRFLELRGDIAYAKKDRAGALTHWQAAYQSGKAARQENSFLPESYVELLKTKITAAGGRTT